MKPPTCIVPAVTQTDMKPPTCIVPAVTQTDMKPPTCIVPAVTQTDMKPPTCVAQLDTTSNERTVDLAQDFHDPGILPDFANQYILGDVYLRSSIQGNRGILF